MAIKSDNVIQPGFRFRHKGLVLSPEDVVLLKLVHDYRYLRIEDLAELIGRGYRKIQERLVKLNKRRYLWRAVFPFRKHIYAIGQEGIAVLVEQSHASKEALSKRLRYHELSEFFLDHSLMTTDIHKRLELATRAGDIKLIGWRDDRDLRDKVSLFEHGEKFNLTVWPDAFFVLEKCRREGENRSRFFLEVDRSTTPHRKFQEKVRAHWHYLDSGKYSERYQKNPFGWQRLL